MMQRKLLTMTRFPKHLFNILILVASCSSFGREVNLEAPIVCFQTKAESETIKCSSAPITIGYNERITEPETFKEMFSKFEFTDIKHPLYYNYMIARWESKAKRTFFSSIDIESKSAENFIPELAHANKLPKTHVDEKLLLGTEGGWKGSRPRDEVQSYFEKRHRESAAPYWRKEREKSIKLGYKTFDGYIVDQYIHHFGKKVPMSKFGKYWEFVNYRNTFFLKPETSLHARWNEGYVLWAMHFRYYTEVMKGDVSWMNEYEKMRAAGWPYRVTIKNFTGNFIDLLKATSTAYGGNGSFVIGKPYVGGINVFFNTRQPKRLVYDYTGIRINRFGEENQSKGLTEYYKRVIEKQKTNPKSHF